MRHRFTGTIAVCAGLLLVDAGVLAEPNKPAPSAAPAAKGSTKAQPKAKKQPEAGGKDRAAIANAQALLASSDRQQVEAGIQSLGLLGTESAVAPLAERIRQGLPPDLLETAIVTLMALGQPSAGPVLYELTLHRRPEIRLRAIEAIAATQPPGAERALLTALSDSDARVRSAAAVGLGDLGTPGAIEKLFLALDRGNMEASGAIGKILPPTQVSRLTEYLGRVPFRSLAPALAQVLQRADVSERAKLDVVARLQEVGTAEVKGYFTDLIAASDGSFSPTLSRALLTAMQEIAE